MIFDRKTVEQALKCCTCTGRDNCEKCPIQEECESNPFDCVIAKYASAYVEDLKAELTETKKNMERSNETLRINLDTYKEYAYNMQHYVTALHAKQTEGYEFSAAKLQAEMDMWQNVAAKQRALEREVEDWRFTAQDNLRHLGELQIKIDRLTKENEALSDEAARYKRYYFNHEYDQMEADVRAATAKKMRDRVYDKLISLCRAEDAYVPFPLEWLDKITEDVIKEAE